MRDPCPKPHLLQILAAQSVGNRCFGRTAPTPLSLCAAKASLGVGLCGQNPPQRGSLDSYGRERMTDWIDQPDAHLNPIVAEAYDAGGSREQQPEFIANVVEVLADLADGGSVVEFAIGTGRIAVPLTEAGVSVSGMDISQPMLDRLNAKPVAANITAIVGDMTSTVMGEDFALAYLVYNTIMNLKTQDAQVECFINAAKHLKPGGRFVIECGLPMLHRLTPGETIKPFNVSEQHLGFEEHVDAVNQISISHHYHINGDRVRTNSPSFRYVWPSELDLMARIGGMELEHRWEDWNRTPFNGESTGHVSVWRKPA